jgi:hypothetical protein
MLRVGLKPKPSPLRVLLTFFVPAVGGVVGRAGIVIVGVSCSW